METAKRTKLDLLNGTPWKVLFVFALPMILSNLFQQLYNMVDAMVASRYVGESALAAIGASYALTNVFIALALGFTMGSAVVISQLYGQKNHEQTKVGINTLLVNAAVIGAVLCVVGLVCSRWMLTALNTPEIVLTEAKIYLDIYFWGLPFLFVYNATSAILNALGDSRTPLKLLCFSSVFNIILDIILVKYFYLGVAGVAIATLIAQSISAIIAFLILRIKVRRIHPSTAPYCFHMTKNMLKIAIPTTIQQCIVFLGMLLVQSVVNGFGSTILAGYTAGSRFESIFIIPLVALGNAYSTYTAQNIGAGQPDRVKQGYKASIKIALVISVIIFVVLQGMGKPLLAAFMGDDYTQLAFDTGIGYIQFLSFFFILMGAKSITDGALRGAGDVMISTVANLVNLSIRIVIAMMLSSVIGVRAVWFAVPIGWLVNLIISFVRYRSGAWRDKEITGGTT